MDRNAFALAALAAAAVPGLDPEQTLPLATPVDERDVAGVTGQDGRRVMVMAPRTTAAGVDLDRDLAVAQALSGTELASVIPPVLGFASLPEGGRAAVTDAPIGTPLMLDSLDDPGLARSLGRVIARTHDVPMHVVEAAGVEVFTAASLREGHRGAMERARRSGHLPAAVAQRWDAVLADDDLWDLTPRFIHQDLSEQAFFHVKGQISAMLGWASARVGDPAADLAWLISALDHDAFDEVYGGYLEQRRELPDRRLLERAQVLGEFAVLEWLLHGLDSDDEEIIADGRAMIGDLEADIAEAARLEAETAYKEMQHPHEALAERDDHLDEYAEADPERRT